MNMFKIICHQVWPMLDPVAQSRIQTAQFRKHIIIKLLLLLKSTILIPLLIDKSTSSSFFYWLGETNQSETAIPGFQINKDTQFI